MVCYQFVVAFFMITDQGPPLVYRRLVSYEYLSRVVCAYQVPLFYKRRIVFWSKFKIFQVLPSSWITSYFSLHCHVKLNISANPLITSVWHVRITVPGWTPISPPPKRYLILKLNIISCLSILAQYPKKYHRSFRCGPFEAEHSKRY